MLSKGLVAGMKSFNTYSSHANFIPLLYLSLSFSVSLSSLSVLFASELQHQRMPAVV